MTWEKRVSSEFTCTSGNKVTAHRPGPSLTLKAQRFLPILQAVGADSDSSPDKMMEGILKLSDDELDKLTDFARIVICDAVDQPVISLRPTQGQYHPDDLPITDFWELFIWISKGCPTIPVKLKEGETSVEAVEGFPREQAGDAGISHDSESIQ